MAEMLIQSESLTAIADKIRVLSGTEDTMGLDDMAAHIGEANNDVATEADLISQIASALEGKAAGGGNDSTSINTGSVTVKYISEAAAIYFVHCIRSVGGEINYHKYNSDGDLLPDDNWHTFPDSRGYYYGPIEFTIPDVVENSFFIISGEAMSSIEVNNETNIEEMSGYTGDPIVFFYKTGNATITITADY